MARSAATCSDDPQHHPETNPRRMRFGPFLRVCVRLETASGHIPEYRNVMRHCEYDGDDVVKWYALQGACRGISENEILLIIWELLIMLAVSDLLIPMSALNMG